MSSATPAPASLGARISRFLSRDTTGGILLLTATVLALFLANTPASGLYTTVRDFTFGIEALHLELSVGAWASDGLLAIFFFVVGLELKQEFVAGSLRDPKAAALPIAAAVGGVALPAIIYTLVNLNAGPDALQGWAVPAATDIAFAVAVLAIVGKKLPPALRAFLLTLAVVDDLLAITIIAIFYTAGIAFVPLLAAIIPLSFFTGLVRRGVRAWWILIPLGVTVWVLVHASGVHATIAGVLLGLAVPAVATRRAGHTALAGQREPLTHHFAEKWSPFSSGVAVPVFAFFSAGVSVGGLDGLGASLTDSIAIGIIAALVLGKAVGITGTAFLITRLPGIRLHSTIGWPDVVGVSFVAGIGFTVSLLVAELSFGTGTQADDHAKVGILAGSLVAAVVGAVILAVRGRVYDRRAKH